MFKWKICVFDDKEYVFGFNILKMNLCFIFMLFLFLIYVYYDVKFYLRRKYYLEKMIVVVIFDLFDSVEMLEYFFDSENIFFEI